MAKKIKKNASPILVFKLFVVIFWFTHLPFSLHFAKKYFPSCIKLDTFIFTFF